MDGTVSTENSASASSGPSTFAEAFAADASSAATDTSQPTEHAATAAQSPEGSESQAPADDRSPFIPRTRFDEVNGKYNELKSWREKNAWVDQIDQQAFQRMQEFYAGFNDPGGDPIALLQQLIDRVSTDPTHGARLRSMAAKQLAAARGQQQAPPAQGPTDALRNTEIVDAQGNVVGTIGQLLDAERAQLEQKFAPALTAAEKIEKSERSRQAADAANQFATTTFGELSTYPGMDDKANQAAVGQAIKAMNLQSDDPRDIRIAADAAWRQVVLPKLSSTAQSKLLDNLQQKAQASTGVNPGSAAPSTPRKITSFHQLGPDAWA
jgi:hypothetical protein